MHLLTILALEIDWSRIASDWGNIVGSLVQTIAVALGGGYSYYRYRQQKRATITQLHVFLRNIIDVRAADHPLDSPGYWVVFSNGTGLPISRWRVNLTTGHSLSSEKYGPILPTISVPMAIKLSVTNTDGNREPLVDGWIFDSGGRTWEGNVYGVKETKPLSPGDIQ